MIRKYLTAKWLLRLGLPIVLIVALLILWFARSSDKNNAVIPSSGPQQNQPTPGETNTNNKSSSAGPSDGVSPGTSQKDTASATGGGQLTLAQAQTFVSNHSPGQNGSGTTEQSTCNTTAGAVCYIEFIKGDITKQLQPKTADSSGSVIWNWDINDAGLTSGSWIIKAVAQLNGQTKSVQDQRQLVIQ